MARILVPTDFGVLAMATTFAAAIDALSQLGLQEALIRRREDDERLHDTAFTLQVGRSVITALAIVTCSPLAAVWFEEPRLTSILWVLAALSVVTGFRNIGIVAFRRDMNYNKQFLLLCVPRLIQVAVTIPIALMLHSYWALILGMAVSKMADLLMSYAVHPYRPSMSLKGWRELAAFSLWTWAASIASLIWNRCDPFIIGPAVGAAQLGIYLLASEIAILPVSELIAPATEVMFAGFAMAQKQGSDPVTLAVPVATTLLLMVMPLVIAVSCASGYIVAALLGPAWTAAQPLVANAAWLGVFSPYSYVCAAALVAANHVRYNFIVNSIASVIKLAGLVVAVSFTSNLLALMIVSVLIVGLEAAVFIIALVRSGDARAGDSAGAVLRIMISAIATLAVLLATGLPWRPVTAPAWQALGMGGVLGCGAISIFMALSYALWWAAGRPDGPEIRAAALVKQVAVPLATKLAEAKGIWLKGYRT